MICFRKDVEILAEVPNILRWYWRQINNFGQNMTWQIRLLLWWILHMNILHIIWRGWQYVRPITYCMACCRHLISWWRDGCQCFIFAQILPAVLLFLSWLWHRNLERTFVWKRLSCFIFQFCPIIFLTAEWVIKVLNKQCRANVLRNLICIVFHSCPTVKELFPAIISIIFL